MSRQDVVVADNVFNKYPDFVKLDNRVLRRKNPVTEEVLFKKHKGILPIEELKGKRVLDLGCCIGASGVWVMEHGAEHYTGVEIQAGYANLARDLLSPFSDRVEIVNSSIEDFLQKASNQFQAKKYDIILLLSVLHVSIDYYQLLKSVASLGADFIVVENLRPSANNDKHPVVEYRKDVTINLAGKANESMSGLGVRISKDALDIQMSTLGFSNSRELEIEEISDSLDVYNNNDNEESRYICRYQKSNSNVIDLAQDLNDGLQGERIPWGQTETPWVFDKRVAANFDHIAKDNIPNYDLVIEKCIKIARKNFGNTARVVDVGSATGYTLRRFYEQGFRNLTGIECSQDMIDLSWKSKDINILCSNKFPGSLGKFEMVIANWVVHFIHERKEYLRSIYEQLDENGILILTEKVTVSDLTTSLYYDFKLENGIDAEEIRLKKIALKNVLVTQPISWYLDTLNSIGFKHIEIIDASFSFVSILACKNDSAVFYK